MSLRPSRSLLGGVVLASVLAVLSGCSDDDPTGDDPTIVGSWEATSFEALGTDFIADGMTLDATLTDAGTYSLEVTNDQVGVCEDFGTTECSDGGSYTSTSSQITLNPGEEGEVTFGYTVTTSTMTWSGAIEGIPVTVTFDRT